MQLGDDGKCKGFAFVEFEQEVRLLGLSLMVLGLWHLLVLCTQLPPAQQS